jgi:hypothetical protein
MTSKVIFSMARLYRGQKVSFSMVGLSRGQKVSFSIAGMCCGQKLVGIYLVSVMVQHSVSAWLECVVVKN